MKRFGQKRYGIIESLYSSSNQTYAHAGRHLYNSAYWSVVMSNFPSNISNPDSALKMVFLEKYSVFKQNRSIHPKFMKRFFLTISKSFFFSR